MLPTLKGNVFADHESLRCVRLVMHQTSNAQASFKHIHVDLGSGELQVKDVVFGFSCSCSRCSHLDQFDDLFGLRNAS
jgi:hypothetical protein